jgi:N-acetylglucosamine-6-sulfatase
MLYLHCSAFAFGLFNTVMASRAAPNLLFLITDDQDLMLGSLDVMPTVQAEIFDAGMSFNRAYASSPVCCPSRTSLFSGFMPHNLDDTTLGWCGNFTAQRENTFTTALGRAGYTIGQFGKWYNEEDTFCTSGYTPEWHTKPTDDFYVMCQEVKYYNMTWNDNGNLTATGDAPTDYLTSVIGNRTLTWLDAVTSNASSSPWLGYVAVHAPHLPATPAPWYANAPVPGQYAPRTPNWNTGYDDKHWQIDNGISTPMGETLINGSDALWASRLRSLMSVEDLVFDVIQLLKERNQLDNTYIFYTSDHGYHMGQFAVWAEKAGPYETDARVPFAVRGPGITPGSSTNALVTNVDFPATLLELAGIPNQWPDGLGKRDGTSLLPVLTSAGATPAGWRDRILIEFVGWQTWQWLAPCQFGFSQAKCGFDPPAGLTNAASNCYTSLRVLNSTADTLYAEYRPPLAPLRPALTNWTEAYNVTTDPWQITNIAVKGRAPNATLHIMHNELWSLANCQRDSCP